MTYRVLPLLLAALALAFWGGAAARAEEKSEKEGTHEGIVVKAGDGMLTMTGKDGKGKHSHTVAEDATITCGGKECKLEDLKKGYRVKVTIEKKDGKFVATKIAAKKAAAEDEDK